MAFSSATHTTINARVRRALRKTADSTEGELNVVPFLDIIMNVMLFILATLATTFTAAVKLPAMGSCATPCTDRATRPVNLGLTVQVLATGYIVASSEGYLQTDCKHFGPAVTTLPAGPSGLDGPALSRCLATLRDDPAFGPRVRPVQAIQLSVNGSLPYEEMIRALDATRETRPGAADLFAEPRLGILR